VTADVARPVLFASEYYPPFAPGGAEWTNAEWAKALARRGQPVVVVTPNYGAARREIAEGVEIIRVPFPRVPPLMKRRSSQVEVPTLVHGNPLWNFYFAACIAWVAYRRNVRAIHAQGKGAIVAVRRAGRLLGRPALATIRDLGLICPLGFCTLFEKWETFDCSYRQYASKCTRFNLEHYHGRAGRGRRAWLWLSVRMAWLAHLMRRRALAGLDAIVGVSRGILAVYPARVVPTARRHVVYPLPPSGAVPTAEEAARVRNELGIGDGPLVLYVGKHSLGKGTLVLLDALDRIRAAVPGTRFVFAGKGETALPASGDVHVLGVLSHARLFPLYRAADVVVAPSIWPEPLSRVLVEAMHFGRPVVATFTGGSPEAVEDGVTGLLVRPNDPGALADAIVALLRDPGRRERMGAAARARLAAVFGEDKIVASLLDAYAAAGRRSA
jgi:glycosyltransferase involved in cell wall biosynthesis